MRVVQHRPCKNSILVLCDWSLFKSWELLFVNEALGYYKRYEAEIRYLDPLSETEVVDFVAAIGRSV